MLLRAEFVALAMRLQEMADGKTEFAEAGARNSKADLTQLQTIHDAATSLGANCSMAEAARGASAGKSSCSDGNGPKHDAQESGSQPKGLSRETSGAASGERETLHNSIQLVESASTLEPIVLREARADYEIKLIAPGKGASAFYPAEVLKRDGPKVFKAGTHVYLNHPTAAEEAARPEGDVKNLAGVLTTDAVYHESHAKGPGLYGRMKVFADHAQSVEEKAAHVGMSIRASGNAESGKQRDGLPILKELTSAESVDVVTRAGAGGMILTEAARSAEIPTQEAAMDAAELKKLQDAIALQESTNKALLARAIRGDARELATATLKPLALQEASKARVVDLVMARELPMKDGALDEPKFIESVNAEAKAEGAYVAQLLESGKVRGMGAGAPIDQTPEKIAEAKTRREAEVKDLREAGTDAFTRLMGGNKKAAEAAAGKGVAA